MNSRLRVSVSLTRGNELRNARSPSPSNSRVSDDPRRSASKSQSTSPRLLVPASPRLPSPRPRVSVSPRPSSLITLLTDFGLADYFVGAMKGVILSVNPKARLVDITHEIPGQDVEAAAFTLLAAYRSFAAGTIHVAVVDPGVGSARRPIVVVGENHFLVGPDNGVFSYVIEREPGARVFHITNERYFQQPLSNTFHGRDIFAPVAAALSTGVAPQKIGSEIDDPVRLESLAVGALNDGSVRGRILHIDRFGNCITNLTEKDLSSEMIDGGARLKVRGRTIDQFRTFFADHTDNETDLFALWGSAGFLEIASRNRSAAKLLKARCGDSVPGRTGV